ncbi:DDE-type integrase/transposase/recombinase [Myxococcus xanthus]|uniref:integrase core domain-containing protein n=1 Tax=Myxococcus xanthus TaxID=34 RepID=UPI001916D087|nr:DDE-type integrase/transposase/recombinase [Myxococcus xanthus]
MAETMEARFGPGALSVPHLVESLSDNGPVYTAKDTRNVSRSLGLLVCPTPTTSPESDGMAEAFVKTFKHDYVYVNELPSDSHVHAQWPPWFDDYNRCLPHSRTEDDAPPQIPYC